jgi:N-carbamoylputrescine amidase
MVPVVASNRIGVEQGKSCSLRFFGSSFIANQFGEKIAESDEETESFLLAEIDLEAANQHRLHWNLFRDRRPDLYRELLSLDGEHCHPAIIERSNGGV